jgi:hypothetical protein
VTLMLKPHPSRALCIDLSTLYREPHAGTLHFSGLAEFGIIEHS